MAHSLNEESVDNKKVDMKIIISNLLLIVVCIIWGSGFAVVKETMQAISPELLVAMRFGVAAVLLGLFSLSRTGCFKPKVMLAGFLLSVPLYLAFYLQTVGLVNTTAANAGFITGMHVIFTPILCFICFKKKIKTHIILGVLFTTFGLAFMSISGNMMLFKGDLLILATAFTLAVHMVLLSKYTLEYDGIWLSFAQIFWVAVIGFCVAFKDIGTIMTLQGDTVFSLLYLGAAGTAFAYLVQTVAQKYTSPVSTAIIFQTESIFSAVFGYFLLGEILVLRQWIGAVLILTGILICELWPLIGLRKKV